MLQLDAQKWKTSGGNHFLPSFFDCVNVRVWPLDGALGLDGEVQ